MILLVVLIASALVLVWTAVLVALECSLRVARRDRLERWVDEAQPRAAAALATFDDRDGRSTVARVGVCALTVTFGWLVATPVVTAGTVGRPGWTSPLLLALGLIFGVAGSFVVHHILTEALPRAVAVDAPEQTLCRIWPLQRRLVAAFVPLTLVAELLARLPIAAGGAVAGVRRGTVRSRQQLEDLLDEAHAGGTLQSAEHGMLVAALSFRGQRVRDVMAPRDSLVTVPRDATIREAEDLVHRSGHSRVLVLSQEGEQVAGFLHAKDLILLGAAAAPDDPLPPGITRIALWVQPDELLVDVLPRMRRARRHVAVVLDGADVAGLVTLEDLLEAIVGDIRDESDRTGSSGER